MFEGMTENKSTVWIAHKSVIENGVLTYTVPVSYELDVKATNSYSDLVEFGAEHVNYMRAIVRASEATINELDRCWIGKTPPVTYDKLATTANYVVKNKPKGYIFTPVTFEKIR